MPCRPWPNSWNRVRASSGDSSEGSPSAPLEKLQILRTSGAVSPSSFCWSGSEVIQAPERFEFAVAALHFPDPDVRVPDRDVLALGEGDAEQARGAVEGRVDHVIERE